MRPWHRAPVIALGVYPVLAKGHRIGRECRDQREIIGTGATGVQLIPEVARKAAALTVYQRTPIWVVPKVDFAIPAAVQTLFAKLLLTQRAARCDFQR